MGALGEGVGNRSGKAERRATVFVGVTNGEDELPWEFVGKAGWSALPPNAVGS